jgi:hypothetical protein
VSTTTEPRVVDNSTEHRYELWVVDERAGVIEYGTSIPGWSGSYTPRSIPSGSSPSS